MQDFDKLWDYSDVPATEVKFRELLAGSSPERNLSYHIQLLTQTARTYSLRNKFAEAHELLDTAEALLPASEEIAHVRYHLERGRSFNSAGYRDKAKVHFTRARQIAERLEEDFYLIDAIHMQAIAAQEDPEEAIRLNEEALALAEWTTHERAKGWLGSLYNNLGWSYHDQKNYEKALDIFQRSLRWREEKKQAPQIFIAKYSVGRTLRSMGNTEEALRMQLALWKEAAAINRPDGYIHEELGELYLLKNDSAQYPFHFQKAYELLSADSYLQKFEKERLARIKKLSE